jgi:hypothetical protein
LLVHDFVPSDWQCLLTFNCAGKNQTAGRKLARSGVFGKKNVGKSPFGCDCVVADAVVFEPVSIIEFPANREINRENREIGG